MCNLKYIVLLVYLVHYTNALESDPPITKNPGSKFIKCDPSKDTVVCPTGSNCIDNGTKESFCICGANYTVNEDYSNGKVYCVAKNETVAPTTQGLKSAPTSAPPAVDPAPTAAPTSAPTTTAPATTKAPPTTQKPTTTTTTTKKPDPPTEPPKPVTTEAPKPLDDIKITPAPTHHHILGGIFIPTFLVLGFICGAFAIRKYDLITKAQELIRNRNNQQRYNGLIDRDFDDDDPLLI